MLVAALVDFPLRKPLQTNSSILATPSARLIGIGSRWSGAAPANRGTGVAHAGSAVATPGPAVSFSPPPSKAKRSDDPSAMACRARCASLMEFGAMGAHAMVSLGGSHPVGG
jgi:hypothetical protein